MKLHTILWHIDRVANSGILGVEEKASLKRGAFLLRELAVIADGAPVGEDMPEDIQNRLDNLLNEATK